MPVEILDFNTAVARAHRDGHVQTNESEAWACPFCQTAARCDTGYFDRPFDDPDIFAGTSEAISETLGFRSRHGASLLYTPGRTYNRAYVAE